MVKYSCTTNEKVMPEVYFDALGQPARRQIVELLAARCRCSISDFAEELEMSVPGALKHVRILEESGLIKTHKQGRTLYSELNPESLDGMIDWLLSMQQFWSASFDKLEKHLESNTK